MTGGATWERPYIHTNLVNLVYKFERNPLKTLGEIAIFANCGRRRTTDDGRTDDGRIAMTKAHLAFGRMS